MGPIGWPETVFIFFLALILFGPKKLPELGRTVGKAMSDFQRAKSQFQDAFNRETKQLGLDTEMPTSFADPYRVENSTEFSYGSGYEGLYGSESYVSPEPVLPSVSPQGAGLTTAV